MTEIVRDSSTPPDMTKECSCELPEEPQIVLHEEAEVRDVEQNHGQPVHAEAEGVTAPLFGIVCFVAARFVDLLENGWMDHARAGNFNPWLAALERFRFHINLEARLGERKIMRPKFNFRSGAKEFPHEKFEGAFQIGHAHAFI